MKKEICLIFFTALIVKIAFLFDFNSCPSFLNPLVDAKTYWQLAKGLLHSAPITAEWFWQAPFYPLFLALLQLLTGESFWGVKILQAVIGSATCSLVFILGRKLFNRKVGLLAAILTIFYAPLLYFESEFLANVLEAFVAVGLILLIIRFQESPVKKIGLFLGLLAAAAIFIRPTFVPFAIIAFTVLLIQLSRSKTLKVGSTLFVLLGFAIVAVPFVALRYQAGGDFGIAPYSGGINLYIGNGFEREKAINARPGKEWDEMQERVNKLGYTTLKEASGYFTRQTVDYVFSHPVHFVKGLLNKSVQFVAGSELPRNEDIYMMREWSGMLHVLLWKVGRFGFPFSLFFPLFVVGLVAAFRKVHWSLPLFIFLYAASIILVFNSSRYRTPIIPVASIFAAYGVFVLGGVMGMIRGSRTPLAPLFSEQKRGGEFLCDIPSPEPPSLFIGKGERRCAELAEAGMGNRILPVLFIISLFVTLSGPYPEEKISYRAEFYNLLGKSALQEGKIGYARDYYKKAISLDSLYDDPYYNLGCLYIRADANREALIAFQKTINITPFHKRAIINAFYLHQMVGDSARADSLLAANIKLLSDEPDMVQEWDRVLSKSNTTLLRQMH